MRSSRLLFPTLRQAPREAATASHQLMLRSGMIRRVASGIYSWLPLGRKVLKKMEDIVRKHHDRAGAQEVLLPCIQPISYWEESGRYGSKEGDLSEQMLLMEDRNGVKMVFAPTAEEVICSLFKENVTSYKSLSLNLYQINWKFRDEIRPRFGVMRGREFLMKDAYSFHINYEEAQKEYLNMMRTYLNIFAEAGLKTIPVVAPTGSIGGDMSHEFHVLANTGESLIYYESALEDYLNSDNVTLEGLQKFYAMEEEKHDAIACPIAQENLREKRGIEVGHIFYLGDKYSKKLGLEVQDSTGALITPVMGTYGIGVSRLIGAVIEAYHDENGIIWPESLAPYTVAVINLRPGDQACDQECEALVSKLERIGHDVIYEDRDCSAGQKFADMDLIGIPHQLVVGPKGLANSEVEYKSRADKEKKMLKIAEVLNFFSVLKAKK